MLPLLLACTALAAETNRSGQAVVTPFDHTPLKDAVRSVLLTRSGQVIAGANTLAVYDGQQWRAVPTPQGYGFRALAGGADVGDRLYVGGIGALGTIDWINGAWHFSRVGSELLNPGDVWSVHPFDDGALWVGTGALYRARDSHVETLPLSVREKPTAFTSPQGVILHEPGTGLLRVGPTGSPELLVREADLPARPLNWAVVLQDGTIWLGLGEAAYRWKIPAANSPTRILRGAFHRLDGLSDALQGTVPTSAAVLADGRVAIGTFRGGIVLADAQGNVSARLTAADGLGGGAVFALAAHENQLWLAQTQGVLRLDAPGQARFFERRRDLSDDTPRRVFATEDRTLLLGTNGVSAIRGDEVARLAEAEVTWDVTESGGSVWIGGFGGIWKTDGANLERVHHVSTDVLCLAGSHRFPGALVFTEGYDLKLLIASPHGGWAARDLGFRALDTPVSVIEDDRENVWLSTMKGGIYRFRWMEGRGEPASVLSFGNHYRVGVGLPRALTRPVLTQVGGSVLALAEEGIFRADGARFVPVDELKDFIGVAATPATGDERKEAYLLVQHRTLTSHGAFGAVELSAGSDDTFSARLIEVPGIDSGPWTSIAADSTALWLAGPKGVLRVAKEALRTAPPAPAVRLATSPQPAEDAPDQTTIEDTKPRGASFAFPATTAITGRAAFYQTRLVNGGEEVPWSAPTVEARREFSQLAPGKYAFEVRAMDRFGRTGPIASQSFAIPAPWWRTPIAFGGYGAGLVLLVLAGARLRIRTLERQNERLNRLVAERTRELEMSNTAKSEFLENISHEIRNPLNGLTGLMALMKEDRLAPAERAHVKSLKAVATTLANVFEDVLQFSKIEYGYVRLNPRPFRLRELLEELVAVFTANREQHGCEIALEWPTGESASEKGAGTAAELADGFIGDPDRIRTVIANFLGNAVKYAPQAPVTVRVMATEESAGHVDLYIDVIDRGPGIPPEEQELIFKKFVRGSRAKEQQIPGTGLGLATCNVLARLMNGQVSVESTPGRGSTFSLRLLLKRAPGEIRAAVPAQREQNANHRPRALVLDDEPYNRIILEGLALELGYEPALTANPAEAIERLGHERYDVIFLDWELPGMKGGDVAQQIRALPHGRDPIILATTAHDSDEMQQRCRDSGMDGFLLKPFDARRVRAAIDTVREWRESHPNGTNANTSGAPFWSEHPLKKTNGLDLSAFDQYARARPDDPHGGRTNYLATLAAQRAALEQAATSNQRDHLADTAHRLRALAGLIRAKQLNEVATELESAARNDNVSTNSHQLKAVLAACDELRRRLEETA